jgi:hypothetical protein
MDSLAIVWSKWIASQRIEAIATPIASGKAPPKRESLSDRDPELWPEKNASGGPRDPWQQSMQIELRRQDGDAGLYLFSASSRGGMGSLGDLARNYDAAARPNHHPVITLTADYYRHKQFGRVEVPRFRIVAWVPKTAKIDAAADTADALNDAIRF